MTFKKLCSLDDVWEGEMEVFEIDGHEVLVCGIEGGEVRAFQAVCPHQDIPLVEGKFDGKHVICRAHQWVFDANNGLGVNPGDCKLARYPLRIEGNEVLIDTSGVQICYAHT